MSSLLLCIPVAIFKCSFAVSLRLSHVCYLLGEGWWSWASVRQSWLEFPGLYWGSTKGLSVSHFQAIVLSTSVYVTCFPATSEGRDVSGFSTMGSSFLSCRSLYIPRSQALSGIHPLIFASRFSGKIPQTFFLCRGDSLALTLWSDHPPVSCSVYSLPALSAHLFQHLLGRTDNDGWRGIKNEACSGKVKSPIFLEFMLIFCSKCFWHVNPFSWPFPNIFS